MITLHLGGNGHEAKCRLVRANTLTGLEESDTLHANLFVRIAATPKGTEIDAALKKSLNERPNTPGDYYAIYPGIDIDSKLATYTGKKVYEIIYDSAGDIFATTECLVVDQRRL